MFGSDIDRARRGDYAVTEYHYIDGKVAGARVIAICREQDDADLLTAAANERWGHPYGPNGEERFEHRTEPASVAGSLERV